MKDAEAYEARLGWELQGYGQDDTALIISSDPTVRVSPSELRHLYDMSKNFGDRVRDWMVSTGHLPPNAKNTDNAADAMRHAFGSLNLTYLVGAANALKLGNAHERSYFNSTAGRLMDLYNNYVGRDLAVNNPGIALDDIDQRVKLILGAWQRGYLVEKPPVVPGDHGDNATVINTGGK